MRPRILIISGILFCIFAGNVWASKIDTIYFQNGDRITGEVKLLENNYLKLSTNDAGTLFLEWNKIDSVKILNPMRIVLKNGAIYYGKLLPSGELRSCYLWSSVGDPRLSSLTEIVYLTPFEKQFLNRFSGSLGSGFSYTKASEVMQVNLNGSVKYQAEKNLFELSYDGIVTRQDTTETSQRHNGGVSFQRILPRNWFMISKLNFESNTELDLDLRTSLGFGGGNNIVNSNKSNLFIVGGIQGTREITAGDGQFNVEGLLGTSYEVFIYDSPKITFNFSAFVTPSLNDLGRVRFDVDSDLSWEIFSDFYLKWNFYYSYDSRPPSASAAKNDWAVSLLGIEYKL